MNSPANFLRAIWNRFNWHVNRFLVRRLGILNFFAATLTVQDAFGTPGDTLLTSIVCREIKKRYRRIKINCITPNPALLIHDPSIDMLNHSGGFFSIQFWYLDLILAKSKTTNVLQPTLENLGIRDYHYHARVYLTDEELENGRKLVANLKQPIITINTMSREMVKVWPIENWRTLIKHLGLFASVVQIGDNREPTLEGTTSFAGKLSMRESMALLAQAKLHIGPDSFLMHAANGVDVLSIIIYGGSRPPGCFGYSENVNLYVDIECSPCWLHDSYGQKCPYAIKCMPMITPEMVLAAVKEKLGHEKSTGQSREQPGSRVGLRP
ncbi:MAG: glycosyltransferase family 9 protein [Methylacidiphilales bacterium]|nr:glycosyltransferase family 9 protein [Candidatus Methylacidiphilales bacterium]